MKDPALLYNEDFLAWTKQQAAALRAAARRSTNQTLDWEHLAEEVEDLGKSVRHALASQLRRILHHLIKLEYSPALDPRRGWRESIREARSEIETLVSENPSLKRELARFIVEQLPQAVKLAAADLDDYGELGPAGRPVLESASYTMEQVLGDWFPLEPPRHPRRTGKRGPTDTSR